MNKQTWILKNRQKGNTLNVVANDVHKLIDSSEESFKGLAQDAAIALNDSKETLLSFTLAQIGASSWTDSVEDKIVVYKNSLNLNKSENESYVIEVSDFVETNYDITANWALNGVTNQATFITWAAARGMSNIVVTNFNLNGNSLQCNLTANGTTIIYANQNITNYNKGGLISGLQNLHLYNNQIVTFNPSIALPSSLQGLDLSSNQIVTFNPSIALPSSLQGLDLSSNRMTTSGYTASETWANAQPSFISNCVINFSYNINSVSGTNLYTILSGKNTNITV